MHNKLICFAIIFSLMIIMFACSQGEGENLLLPTDHQTVIDGQIQEEEYSIKFDMGRIVVHFIRDQEFVRFGLKAQTNGWLAIGFGSSRMNNSQILIAYVKENQTFLRQELGKGHGHSEVEMNLLTSYAVKEDGEYTILEAEIPVDKLLSADTAELSIITAYGREDDFNTYHGERQSFKLVVK